VGATIYNLVFTLHSGHVLLFRILFHYSFLTLYPRKAPSMVYHIDGLSHLVSAE